MLLSPAAPGRGSAPRAQLPGLSSAAVRAGWAGAAACPGTARLPQPALHGALAAPGTGRKEGVNVNRVSLSTCCSESWD